MVVLKKNSKISGPKTLHWTGHSKMKMRQYGLSESRVKRIMHTPMRIEYGIAPETIAMMQPAGSKKHPYELWVMIVETKAQRKIISAWRYPGQTKLREALPEHVMHELRRAL
ncbi:MAG: hypothetical protein Q7S28_04050 [bacterium]|nr:hypothetical protein [bacterium]